MNIIINTDSHVKGSEEFKERFTNEVDNSLKRYEELITRVDVFASDENRGKQGPNDKKCVVEVRLKGQDPLVVSHLADTLDHALNGALNKINSVLATKVGKLQNHS